ncbi:MAG: metallopeptidase family protein [Geminicoccaceae bacterium]
MTAAERPPTADRLGEIAEAILANFPAELRQLVGLVAIKIQDWADDETLDAMEIEDPLDLTGLYQGVPIGERAGLGLPPELPELIFLFRMPILFEWCERGCALKEVVFDVLTHEIGHHFGLDETAALRLEGR